MVAWLETTPTTSMTKSWLFPPQTREAQFDEKWSFVGKKQENCDPDNPADAQKGDYWDHVAYDPEHRLVVCVVPGARGAENTEEMVADFKRRTEGRTMSLITSDEHRPYKEAILQAYGVEATVTPSGLPVRAPHKVAPPELCYATVHKIRRLGTVAEILIRLIFGTAATLAAALKASLVSRSVNVSFLERQHLTDRHRNARKARKTYRFSKDWKAHEAATFFTLYTYNFCWPVRTLRVRSPDECWQQRTPAMAAGLTDHVWSLHEWLKFPSVKRE
jgi:IS1 family transposase